MHHELKTWAPYFQQVRAHEKRFEIRKNDRNFQVGDTVTLFEVVFDAADDRFEEPHSTGRAFGPLVIDYVFTLPKFGLCSGHCIFTWKIPT